MSLLSLFSFAVFAAETMLSPIPDNGVLYPTPTPTPEVSFGALLAWAPPEVLGITTEPTPTPLPHRKNSYTIAVLGDSMVDTLGPGVPHLQAELKRLYPGVSFTIFNYGVGGENIDSGISRLTNNYTYLGQPIDALLTKHPDIVVVESFGYNPFIDPGGELDRHWLAMAKIADTLANTNIVIAATIAPNAEIFGDGALNWNSQQKQEKVARINALLENAIKFAKSQHLPLADAYTPSGASLEYINPGDHIHYSDRGRELFAKKVTESIVAYKLLE